MRRTISRILLVLLLLFSAFSFVACTGPSDGNGRGKSNSNAFVLSKESAIKKLTETTWARTRRDYYGDYLVTYKFSIKEKALTITTQTQREGSKPKEYYLPIGEITWNTKTKTLLFARREIPSMGYKFVFENDGKVKFTDMFISESESERTKILTKFDN